MSALHEKVACRTDQKFSGQQPQHTELLYLVWHGLCLHQHLDVAHSSSYMCHKVSCPPITSSDPAQTSFAPALSGLNTRFLSAWTWGTRSLRFCSCVCICRGNSQHTVSELLKVSASTIITNKLGLTPLAEAIVSGQLANARLLLAKVPHVHFAEYTVRQHVAPHFEF